MAKRILMRITKYKQLIIAISIALAALLLMLAIEKKPFIFNQDQWLQYRYFYEEWYRMIKDFIKSGDLPFYSWNNFLGTDFFSSKGYYVTGDLLMPFYWAFNNVDRFLLFETIVCVFVSSFAMYAFLKQFGIKNEKILNVGSICYALSGFAVLYIGQYMFHRFYSILPLLFYGIERFIHDNKKTPFTIAVCLLFMQNYYLMFPTSILMAFYIMFSIFYNNKQAKGVKIVLNLFLLYLVGFAISGIISFPSIGYILNNKRLGQKETTGLFMPIQSYVGLVINWISHFPERVYDNCIHVADYNGHLSFYSFFFGGLPFLGTLALFKKERNKSYLWLIVTIAFLLFAPLNSIIHGFSVISLRWTFPYVLFAILLSAIYFDSYNDTRDIVNVMIVYCLLVVVVILVGTIVGCVSFDQHKIHLLVLLIYMVVESIQVFFYTRKSRFTLLSVYLCLIASMLFNLKAINDDNYYYDDTLDTTVIDYIQEIDSDDPLFRIYVDPKKVLPTSDINLNYPLHYDYMGTQTYDTTYDYNLDSFIKSNGINLHIINLSDYNVCSMLGTKYYLVDKESELPNNDFEYVLNVNHLKVYKDNNYAGFAHTYNSFTAVEEVDYSTFDWSKLVVDNVEDYKDYENNGISHKLKIDIKQRNYLQGHINLDNPSVLLIPIPANKGWKITDNGKLIEFDSVNGGFIGIKLDDGYHDITMNFISPYFKEGLLVSAAGFVVLIVLIIKDKQDRIKL